MNRNRLTLRKAWFLLACGIFVLLVCAVAYIIFTTASRVNDRRNDSPLLIQKRSVNRGWYSEKQNKYVHEDIARLMNVNNIKAHSSHYSLYPHPPGSKRNALLAKEMAKEWKKFGFDKTEIFKYRLLLPFPQQPAEIHLKKRSKLTKKLTVNNEPPFGTSEMRGKPIYPFHAYSISGNITGEIVYCNYGMAEDYSTLRELGVKLKYKIHMLRYGAPASRSELLERAVHHGSIAVIFYSDPAEHSYRGQEYPHGWMLNKYGVQRGSIWNKFKTTSDPLSIGYPSKEHYFRERRLPEGFQYSIPSQPISASTASEIFQFMNDESVELPKTFRGEMNISYVLQSGKDRTVTLKVNNKLRDKESLVVCGTLFGYDEADRYVVIGNHRDAWVYGAADPVSGSAVMTELVRALGGFKIEYVKYRPRRSVMACSWGGEEAGMLGSTEWAAENSNFLSTKVIAYLNVDMAVEGNYTIQIKSLDDMIKTIFQAAKYVRCPEQPDITLYDDMLRKHTILLNRTRTLKHPEYQTPGGHSDDIRFSQRYGIAVSDYRYIYNKLDFPRLATHNGHYHTLYDSFDWMNKFVDPTFQHHLAVGKLWLKHLLLLSDSLIIPLDIEAYTKQIQRHFHAFLQEHNRVLKEHNINCKFVTKRLKLLVSRASRFQHWIEKVSVDEVSFHKRRAINDIIMNFEKHFILKSRAGENKLMHVVYAGDKLFSGIVHAIQHHPGSDWGNVRREITLFMWCVDMANESLDLSELQLQLLT